MAKQWDSFLSYCICLLMEAISIACFTNLMASSLLFDQNKTYTIGWTPMGCISSILFTNLSFTIWIGHIEMSGLKSVFPLWKLMKLHGSMLVENK